MAFPAFLILYCGFSLCELILLASLLVSCISPQRLFGLALGAVELKLKHFQFDFRV